MLFKKKKTETQEEEINPAVKEKSRKRVGFLLVGINIALVAVLVGVAIYRISSLVNNNSSADSLITFYDLNSKDSQTLYNELLNKNDDGYDVTYAYDYGVYGSYLHLSEYKMDVGSYSSFSSLYLKKIKSKTNAKEVVFASSMNKVLDSTYLDGGIDLSLLDEGNYIVYADYLTSDNYSSKHEAVKIASAENIDKTFYTTLDNSGNRKKIQLLNNSASPCLVIKVNNVSSLPQGYYDYVIVSDHNINNNFSSDTKVVYTTSLKEAYSYNASMCLAYDNVSSNTVSYYLKDTKYSHDELISEGKLINNDKNDYIRELGGHLTNAASCTKGVEASFTCKEAATSNDFGKYVILMNGEYNV